MRWIYRGFIFGFGNGVSFGRVFGLRVRGVLGVSDFGGKIVILVGLVRKSFFICLCGIRGEGCYLIIMGYYS